MGRHSHDNEPEAAIYLQCVRWFTDWQHQLLTRSHKRYLHFYRWSSLDNDCSMQTARTHFTTPNPASSRLRTIRIHVSELQLGMFVCELDRPWSETSFLLQGFTVKNGAEIKALRKYCEYVDIEEHCATAPARRPKFRKVKETYQSPGMSRAAAAHELRLAAAAYELHRRRRFVPRSVTMRMLTFSLLLMLPMQASAEGHPEAPTAISACVVSVLPLV